MPDRRHAGRFGAPLRLYIFLLATAVSLPLVALAGFLLHDIARTTQQLHRQTAIVFARQLASDIERRLEGYVSALEALRTSPSLQADLETFYQQALEVAQINGSAIVLRDPSGQQLLNTLRPFGATLPRSTSPELLEADRQALAIGQPAVSALYHGAVSQQLYTAIVVPVRVATGPATLNIGVLPANFARDLEAVTPATWTSAIVDQTGRIIARSKDLDKFLGTKAVGVDPRAPDVERVWDGRTASGEEVFAAQVRLRRSGWVAAVSIPRAEIAAATGNQSTPTVILAISALALSLIAALVFTRLLAKPLDRLRGLDNGPPGRFVIRELETAARELGESRDRQLELMREVNHRAKNLLSVVLAIARMTAGNTQEKDYARQLAQRIGGLSASHDLLVDSEWTVIGLGSLVEAQLKIFGGLGVQLPANPSAVPLNPVAAQAIGMALHELATNALKHGAGSRVAIDWHVDGESLRFEWREQGPNIRAPMSSGFGRRLLTTYVEQCLSATVDYVIDEGDVRWRLVAPVDEIKPATKPR